MEVVVIVRSKQRPENSSEIYLVDTPDSRPHHHCRPGRALRPAGIGKIPWTDWLGKTRRMSRPVARQFK
jgi:hypothetical protein